nr:helix-turn-helix transcriptional regulator [uncultured Bdellovibrio sp.]
MNEKEKSQASPMLHALRGLVKSSDITYEDLGKKMGLSPDTIKRLLNGRIPITLQRISEICDILEIDLYELARLSKFGSKGPTTFLTLEQEKALASDDELFAVFYLAVMGFSFEEISRRFKFSHDKILKIALELESFGILELHPKNKLKMTVYRKVRWNMNGPLHKKYMVPMAVDFATDVYQTPESFKFFFNCPLSADSQEIVLRKLRELGREIEHMSEMDLNIHGALDSNINILIGAKKWMPEVVRKLMK